MCREFVGLNLAVEGNHRDAAIHHLLHRWGDFGAGDGRHNNHIHAAVGILLQQAFLQFHTVVGIGKAQFHIVVEIGGCLQFGIEFLAPRVLAALHHCDYIFFGTTVARCHHAHQHCGNKDPSTEGFKLMHKGVWS